MCVEILRNGDGKIANRIARDLVLQIDDNVFDHLNALVRDIGPGRRQRKEAWHR